MIAFAIVIGILVLIALLPVGGSVKFDESGVVAKIIFGPARIQIVPKPQPKSLRKLIRKAEKSKQKLAKESENKKSKPKKEKKEATPEEKAKKGGMLPMLLEFVKLGLNFLGSFRRKLLIRQLQLYLVYGGGEPDKTAVNYGNTLAAAHGVLPLMRRSFRIRKQDIRVFYDPAAAGTKVYANAAISIRIGQIIALAALYGIRALKIYLNHKKEKAVAK